MSQTASTSTSSPSSNFNSIFHNAIKAYEEKTKKDLLAHPLAAQLQACRSPNDILVVLQKKIEEFNRSRTADERLSRWLSPTINVLYAFSATIGGGVGIVFSPARVIFSGVGVLLSVAKDVEASQDALVNLFGRIENFFKRLESYTAVRPTDAMTDIIVNIMVEVLNIFAIATKEMMQGRAKKYLRKLIGKKEIEGALNRLDRLTQEEARMAAAEVLRLIQIVNNQVTTVNNKVTTINNKVTTVINDGKDTKKIVQKLASGVDDIKWNQSRNREWVNPPDPSINHSIACDIHCGETAKWFFQGSMFGEWQSTGSLLWIYGKPGSGKTILCSSIVQDIETRSKAGLASMAYFYFDFRDLDKQNIRNLLPSLLIQLSAQSDPCRDIFSRLYLEHDNGKKTPMLGVMTQCLKDMLTTFDYPTYIILDALDECPNSSGIPSPRGQVLTLVKDLINLRLPHLHICVTSRPEFDIQATLRPLALHSMSLHDESGQKKDIVDYVDSVVYSDSETMMKRWRDEDKKMVVDFLSKKAGGMFRWVFCQLETLRHCLPQSVKRTLNELPESLDETYERVMTNIKRGNQAHAYRMLQCLAVATRPLSVAELAELLAFDFDAAKGGIPKLNPNWRLGDHEQAVLSTCSSLITVVPGSEFPIVQFSHFSVKEFLMSDRLASSTGDISQYHISLTDAHTVLARACLGVLLRDSDVPNSSDSAPLASYAARHWVAHAQVENVASRVLGGMETLFDPDKPYFESWVQLHDFDTIFSAGMSPDPESGARPLYYATLCGLHELVGHLTLKYPQYVSALGGILGTALHSASHEGHLLAVRTLLLHGVGVNVRGYAERTPLMMASSNGHRDVVQCLLDNGANVNLRASNNDTSLCYAARSRHKDVVRVLLEHSADVNAMGATGTAIHNALVEYYLPRRAKGGLLPVVQLLLGHGANPNAQDIYHGETPLHQVARPGLESGLDLARVLLDHGADVDVKDNNGQTPLQMALKYGEVEIAQLLSDFRSGRA